MLRHAPPAQLAAFDLPDAVGVTGQREVTTLPAHGLFLLNSELVIEQAEVLAESVLAEADLSDDQRIAALFHRTLQRSPTDTQINSSIHHVKQIAAALEVEGVDQAERELKAWASLSQALLATNEFRYVD
jgi:sensor domain CHASE-containing protein